MDEANVAIIVVTPQTGRLLDRCLASIARQTIGPREVVVVLNGCGGADELAAAWSGKLPLKIVDLDENMGFAAVHPMALEHISSKWIALLNADAVAESDWLSECMEVGESSDDIGAVACAVLKATYSSRFESLGMEVGASGAAYLSRWDEFYMEYAPLDVFGAAGAAAMYRRETIDRVGFFDPWFFAYYEDVDLAWRIRAAGYRTVAASRARVHHIGGAFASSAASSYYYMQRNRLAVIITNWPASAILRNFMKIAVVDAASILFSIVEHGPMAAVRARLSILGNLPKLLSMRRRRTKNAEVRVDKWMVDDREKAMKRLRWKLS